jgi:hypothetical protein
MNSCSPLCKEFCPLPVSVQRTSSVSNEIDHEGDGRQFIRELPNNVQVGVTVSSVSKVVLADFTVAENSVVTCGLPDAIKEAVKEGKVVSAHGPCENVSGGHTVYIAAVQAS